ncbi:MAG: hypothetical protein ABW221_20230 [Vicinamibacteria bacterium]
MRTPSLIVRRIGRRVAIAAAALVLLPAGAVAARANAANLETPSGFGRVPLHFERNDAGTIVPTPGRGPRGTDWEIVGAFDYDGDGHTDLLWQEGSVGDVMLWRLDSEARLTEERILHPPPGAPGAGGSVVAYGDFGIGSGGSPSTKDIVLRNPATGATGVWFVNAAGALASGASTVPAAPVGHPTAWTVLGPR